MKYERVKPITTKNRNKVYDYLIYCAENDKPAGTGADIAAALGIKKPQVWKSVRILKNEGLIKYIKAKNPYYVFIKTGKQTAPHSNAGNRATKYRIVKSYHDNPTEKRWCITCGCIFDSEGPHNRMCQRCRTKSYCNHTSCLVS